MRTPDDFGASLIRGIAALPPARDAAETSLGILRQIAPWLVGALALGAGLHG